MQYKNMTDLFLILNYELDENKFRYNKSEYDFNKILTKFESLSDWSKSFIIDINKRFHLDCALTQKQIDILNKLLDEIFSDQEIFEEALKYKIWTNPIYVSKEIELKAKFEHGNIIFQCKDYQARRFAEQFTIFEIGQNTFMLPINSENFSVIDQIFMKDFEFEISNELIQYVENLRKPNEVYLYKIKDNIFGYENVINELHMFENANIYLRTSYLNNYLKERNIKSNILDFKEYIVNPMTKAKEKFELLNFLVINYDGLTPKLIDLLEDLGDEYITFTKEIYNGLQSKFFLPKVNFNSFAIEQYDLLKDKTIIMPGNYNKNLSLIYGTKHKICKRSIALRPFRDFPENQRFMTTSII